jgi:hypothetical protein
LQDPHYRVKTLRQIRSGRLPRNLERYLWQLGFRKLGEMGAQSQSREFHIVLPNEVKDPRLEDEIGACRPVDPERRGFRRTVSGSRDKFPLRDQGATQGARDIASEGRLLDG